MSDKLVINIDSTSLGSSSCIRNFYWTVIGSITDSKIDGGFKSIPSAAIVYGVAVHKFTDVMFKTGDGRMAKDKANEVFKIPKNDAPRTQQYLNDERHMWTTAWNLWNNHILAETSFEVIQLPTIGPATELTFKIPFYEDDFCIINLCGTIDTVGKFCNGCYAIRDWKTTSSHKQNEYMSNYEMSRQLRIYTLACKLMAKSNPDSILGKIGAFRMGAFIDAIFVRPNANDNEYLRSDVFQYSNQELNDFERTLITFCEKLSNTVRLKVHSGTTMFSCLPKEGLLNGTCEQKYSKCRFWDVCKNNEQVGSLLLSRNFHRKIYDPMNFNAIE